MSSLIWLNMKWYSWNAESSGKLASELEQCLGAELCTLLFGPFSNIRFYCLFLFGFAFGLLLFHYSLWASVRHSSSSSLGLRGAATWFAGNMLSVLVHGSSGVCPTGMFLIELILIAITALRNPGFFVLSMYTFRDEKSVCPCFRASCFTDIMFQRMSKCITAGSYKLNLCLVVVLKTA